MGNVQTPGCYVGCHQEVHLPLPELLHDPGAVDLDGLLGDLEIVPDLLVGSPGDDTLHHFLFPRGQAGNAPTNRFDVFKFGEVLTAHLHGVVHCGQQDRLIHRLGEKIRGTRLNRPHAHWDITVTSEENDRHALTDFV